jgi:amino acid transporter
MYIFWIVGIIIFLILFTVVAKKSNNEVTIFEGIGCGVAILICIALVVLYFAAFDGEGGSPVLDDVGYDTPRGERWYR